MANKNTKPLFASGLYIALALTVLAVISIGAYSVINQLIDKTVPASAETPLSKTVSPVQDPPSVQAPQKADDPPISIPEDIPDKEPAAEESSAEEEKSPRVYMSPIDTGSVCSPFSVEELKYSETMNDYRAHTGIDLAAEPGTGVCAFTDGVIESIHADPLMGQTVVLDHGDGLKSIYQNLAHEMPEGLLAGAEVHAGDLIGAVGDTALIECAEESHLHFEIRKDEACVNPAEYLEIEV